MTTDVMNSGGSDRIARYLGRVVGAAALAGVLVAAHSSSAAEMTQEEMIRQALSAAPPTLAETATVKDMHGNVLREGTGAYTCLPDPSELAGPMCLDDQWLAWVDAWMNKKATNTTRIGVAYMMAGDPLGGGASNINPFDTEPTADNQWVVEGPHVMVLVPDPAMLENVSTDPDDGGPYVMWKGTPYAHIMVPVGERPEQRTVAAK